MINLKKLTEYLINPQIYALVEMDLSNKTNYVLDATTLVPNVKMEVLAQNVIQILEEHSTTLNVCVLKLDSLTNQMRLIANPVMKHATLALDQMSIIVHLVTRL